MQQGNKIGLHSAMAAFVLPLLSGIALSAGAPVEPLEPAPVLGGDVDDITVIGQRPELLRQLMLDFIVEIGDPVSRNHGYARWQSKVCVGVHGLTDAAAAQYVADNISFAALQVGLDPRAQGCRPNLQIFFTSDGRELATRLVENSPRGFRPVGGEPGTNQGLQALEEFKTAEVPVRWWHVTMLVDRQGMVAVPNDLLAGGPVVPSIVGANSRIKNAVSDALWGSVIVVDTSKLGDVNWPQLIDYLAMVSLAQVNPGGAPAGYDSILNLFRAGNPPSGMTQMDRSYLQALYEMDTMIMPRIQRDRFAERMVRELRETATSP